MSAPSHIAIVGCGFSGTSALFQLVDRHPVTRITVFESTGDFGPGYPYRADDSSDYLLNNANDTLCLVPSNRRAFLDWLKSRPDHARDLDDKGHLPRSVFGSFLSEVVRTAVVTAAIKGIEITLVSEEVIGLQEHAAGVELWTAAQTFAADAAILTTGRCPDIARYPAAPEGSSAEYIASHIRNDALDALPLDATIHILGASLSAYDVVNRLFSQSTGCRFVRIDGRLVFEAERNERRIVLCSRSGRLKSAQSRRPAELERRHFTPNAVRSLAETRPLSLHDVGEAIRRDAELNGATVDWETVRDPYEGCASRDDVDRRAGSLLERVITDANDLGTRNFLVDLFGDAQTDIWDVFADRLLSPEAEQAFRRQVESAALSYAAPCPIETAEKLSALHRAGRLTVLKGVMAPTFDRIEDRYAVAHEFGVEKARYLVNTTGAVDRDVESSMQPPLIKDLVSRGLLRPDERDGVTMPGAAVDMATMRAKGARNVYLANMLLWGPGFLHKLGVHDGDDRRKSARCDVSRLLGVGHRSWAWPKARPVGPVVIVTITKHRWRAGGDGGYCPRRLC